MLAEGEIRVEGGNLSGRELWRCEASRLLVNRTAVVDARLRLLNWRERGLTFAFMHER